MRDTKAVCSTIYYHAMNWSEEHISFSLHLLRRQTPWSWLWNIMIRDLKYSSEELTGVNVHFGSWYPCSNSCDYRESFLRSGFHGIIRILVRLSCRTDKPECYWDSLRKGSPGPRKGHVWRLALVRRRDWFAGDHRECRGNSAPHRPLPASHIFSKTADVFLEQLGRLGQYFLPYFRSGLSFQSPFLNILYQLPQFLLRSFQQTWSALMGIWADFTLRGLHP